MNTEIKIIANLDEEQLNVLISEIRNISEMINVKLEVESNKIEGNNIICQNDKHDLYGINQMFSKCRKCGQVICDG